MCVSDIGRELLELSRSPPLLIGVMLTIFNCAETESLSILRDTSYIRDRQVATDVVSVSMSGLWIPSRPGDYHLGEIESALPHHLLVSQRLHHHFCV